jgi:putative oxidoreductase
MFDRVFDHLKPFQHLMVRVPLGVIFIAHGGQNLFGWWDGPGLVQSIQAFQAYLGLPPVVTVFALFAQFYGGVLVLIGFVTRLAALLLAGLMVGAIWKVHLAHGFFMNWRMLADRGHGIEMSVALLGMCLLLVCGGAGRFAIDRNFDQ